MAGETTISAGVYLNENDNSFVTQGQVSVGASIIGPTMKGPAFVPTVVTSLKNYREVFGTGLFYGKTATYVPQTVNQYLQQAGSVLVTRVLGNGGFKFESPSRELFVIAHSDSNQVLSVLYPSISTIADVTSVDLKSSSLAPTADLSGSFGLTLSGSAFGSIPLTASFNPTSNEYITTFGNIIGTGPNNSTGSNGAYNNAAWTYVNFRNAQSALISGSLIGSFTPTNIFTSSVSDGFDHASTPWITNGNISSPTKLFKFHHLGDGFDTNKDVYVSISNLNELADINGIPQYSTFNVLIRRVGDSDLQPSILENFNVDLNPNSPNFITKQIGDRFAQYSSTFEKVIINGDFNNISKFIRVEVVDSIKNGSMSPKVSPRGFEDVYVPIIVSEPFFLPTASYQTTPVINNNYNPSTYLGFNFANADNYNYLNPTPWSTNGPVTNVSGSAFSINSLMGHPSASYIGSLSASIDITGQTGPVPSQVKFNVPFQGGTDGIDFCSPRLIGDEIQSNNAFGYNLSNGSAAGTQAYLKATNILSNQDIYDFNILATPGVIKDLHATVVNNTLNMIEERADAFYPIDLEEELATVNQCVGAVQGLDSSYAAVYYPWVKLIDVNTGIPDFFPPSVIVPAVMKRSSNITAPWFAPAGLIQGGIPGIIEVKNQLSKKERDILYQSRINPIATFPGQGIVIYGQKTLQVAKSALDRINVRMLLIDIKKFVNAQGRFLVFSQNTDITRNRFLTLVNPYLQNIQEKQGLYSYSVVMDESNNTNDVIDRNELVGAVYLQPTKTAEFIIIDFNIEPTGGQ